MAFEKQKMYLFQAPGCSLSFFQSCHPALCLPPMGESILHHAKSRGFPKGGVLLNLLHWPLGHRLASSPPSFDGGKGKMKLSFSLSGPSLELWPFLPAAETSLKSFLSEKLHLISLIAERGDVCPSAGGGERKQGEPGAVFSSCWIFPQAASSPHLQNSNKRTKII